MSASKALAGELRRATVNEGDALVSNSLLARAANLIDAQPACADALRECVRIIVQHFTFQAGSEVGLAVDSARSALAALERG